MFARSGARADAENCNDVLAPCGTEAFARHMCVMLQSSSKNARHCGPESGTIASRRDVAMLDRTDLDHPLFFAPFVSSVMRVEKGWIDYNGHLNMAYYNVLFDRAEIGRAHV